MASNGAGGAVAEAMVATAVVMVMVVVIVVVVVMVVEVAIVTVATQTWMAKEPIEMIVSDCDCEHVRLSARAIAIVCT